MQRILNIKIDPENTKDPNYQLLKLILLSPKYAETSFFSPQVPYLVVVNKEHLQLNNQSGIKSDGVVCIKLTKHIFRYERKVKVGQLAKDAFAERYRWGTVGGEIAPGSTSIVYAVGSTLFINPDSGLLESRQRVDPERVVKIGQLREPLRINETYSIDQAEHEVHLYSLLNSTFHVKKLITEKNNKTNMIVFRRFPGENLNELLDKQYPFTTDEKFRLIINLCGALEELHDANIVHCDLKLANVIVSKTMEVRITDLGYSKEACYSSYGGDIPGTAPFAPPEVWNARKTTTDPWVKEGDIWSLARIILFLVLLIGDLRGIKVGIREETYDLYCELNREITDTDSLLARSLTPIKREDFIGRYQSYTMAERLTFTLFTEMNSSDKKRRPKIKECKSRFQSIYYNYFSPARSCSLVTSPATLFHSTPEAVPATIARSQASLTPSTSEQLAKYSIDTKP